MAISPNEAAHRAASDRELVSWVDEADQVLGALPRAELRERGLIGRCTFILLFNSAGELCVHRRTLSKALYPGYWDVAAGGMVTAGEGDADSAAREPGRRAWESKASSYASTSASILTSPTTACGVQCIRRCRMRRCACSRKR